MPDNDKPAPGELHSLSGPRECGGGGRLQPRRSTVAAAVECAPPAERVPRLVCAVNNVVTGSPPPMDG